MKHPYISIKGASQNNLKNIDLEIPINRLTVVSGVSGSGKSSLALDTLYAEGQRRYVETFSPYARQFMDRMDRPQVQKIEHIPPSIAIDRKDPVRTSRSTVGTMTEITDYVKLLYHRLGQLHCHRCHQPVHTDTPQQVWQRLQDFSDGSKAVLTFPYQMTAPSDEDGQPSDNEGDAALRFLHQMGFDRAYTASGQVQAIDEFRIGKTRAMNILVDRFKFSRDKRGRIMDSIELAFRMGGSRMDVWNPEASQHWRFSGRLECASCGIAFTSPQPNLFSFNSPIGACNTCRGFGRTIGIDLELVIPDRHLSIQQGAIKPWGCKANGNQRPEFDDLMDFCRTNDIPTEVPFSELDRHQQQLIIEGSSSYYGINGFFKWLESKSYKMHVRVFLSRYRGYHLCHDCGGARFKEDALRYRIGGRNIAQVYAMNVMEAIPFFSSISFSDTDEASFLIVREIQSRLNYLRDVGLTYLTLDRQSRTLSGGEVQRVALASALGSSLVNMLYVLDEPSIGLHPRDNQRLIRILKGLRDLPNTVMVVEHDPDIIRAGDYLLDLGPKAGTQGGQIIYWGPVSSVNGSLTGQYLQGKKKIALKHARRRIGKRPCIEIRGAAANNLKNISVRIPLNAFSCLTGVSGSGKSTLAVDILYKGLKRSFGKSEGRPGIFTSLVGAESLQDVVLVDQRAIGRTPRSNLLTYMKAMDPVRRLLSETTEAQQKGLGPGYFSFNVAGGRCDACKGEGYEKIEMQFLSDVFVKCPACNGKRFQEPVLAVTYRGKNIYDIMSLTVRQAFDFFSDQPNITKALKPLIDVGLDYLGLGQPISTLSGGEAQRLKLSRYLKKAESNSKQGRLFIFDEPTTGLHFEDIHKLLGCLDHLIEQGHTVLVIEHNLDVIKNADWVIDLGPEGGDEGGSVVVAGSPETVAADSSSHTGRFLQTSLDLRKKRPLLGKPLRVNEEMASFDPSVSRGGIHIRGAREHNLKNIHLKIPHHQLVVLTGVSGSGKSTLAFDILYAEGQRRYLESLTPYVRQYMKIMERPDVDLITGLAPTVAIEQRVSYVSRRSTVATLTEIYHFLRLLFSKLGTQKCPGCGRRLTRQSKKQIIEHICLHHAHSGAYLLVPKISGRKGFHKKIFSQAMKKNIRHVRVDGKWSSVQADMGLNRYQEHTIEWVMGRLSANPKSSTTTLVENALQEGNGTVLILLPDGEEIIYSIHGLCTHCGTGLQALDPRLFSFNSRQGACPKCEGLGEIGQDDALGSSSRIICDTCQGSRLNAEALFVTIDQYSIWDLVQKPSQKLQKILASLNFGRHEAPIADPILSELNSRLKLLDQLGLSYLALSRSGHTLSGGEAQRVRLASQLGSNLTGICYILDEPTIGLHPRDNDLLIRSLRKLRDRGNSIIVVEHDESTIRAADHIIDLGPQAGQKGGHVVAEGTLNDIFKSETSVTGRHLKKQVHASNSRLRMYHKAPFIEVSAATTNNLKNITVRFPLRTLIGVTGVSGSGKSSLLKETLYAGLQAMISSAKKDAHSSFRIKNANKVARVLEVDHSPIGRTPRSIPVSYIGVWTEIRNLFALTPAARAKGYSASRFSFNVTGGRCEACKGQGRPKVSMSFLPDVYVPCESCGGSRYNKDTIAIVYKNKSIADVLAMTFEEAANFFAAIPKIFKALQLVCDVGLGYLQLGQPSPTLSGGEAQRIKLTQQLVRPQNGHTLYVLDEPTTGLHMADVQKLIDVLQRLVDSGNTVAVIEHNLEVIASADYIIDLGPEGGDGGGTVVASGSPSELIEQQPYSYTAHHLAKYLSTNA